ncbi:hypothetical protein ASZ78_016003, partial [Callipepla squamata]
VLVGAPLDLEGRGRVYRCRVGESSCHDAGVGACPTSTSDIVFLIDGSGSVAPFDFERMKTFITEVITRFRGTDTRLHVSFSDFDRLSEAALQRKVLRVEQQGGITQTATAIRYVLTDVFPRSRAGAHRVLLVVTDGQIYGDNLHYGDVIPEADRDGVIRYAIGVGSAFRSADAAQELHTIASPPSHAHVFRVDNFEALRGIQEQLQEKIFAIEGYATESLSVEGLQALALGAPRHRHVGRVLLFVLQHGTWQLHSDAVGRQVMGGRVGCGVGRWGPGLTSPPQVGSYFGAALCALEAVGDDAVLLVGAPMFYGDGAGGRVELCRVQTQGRTLQCHRTLRGQAGHPLGRFGASVARLGDTDGDGLQDVAVGAPMEDEQHGALYVFRGEKGGVSEHYSQRITGALFRSAPQHFGRALSGGRDVTGDGLPDVAVGAQGQLVLLRSPPLLAVDAALSFTPAVIRSWAAQCAEEERPSGAAAVSTAELCFVGTKRSHDRYGEPARPTQPRAAPQSPTLPRAAPQSPTLPRAAPQSPTLPRAAPRSRAVPPAGSSVGATLHLALQLDPGRAARAAFQSGDSTTNGTARVAVGRSCLHFPIVLTLPFERNCGEDNQCVPDLRVVLSFSGLQELVVGTTEELTVTITVHNAGEDAYGAHMELRHPGVLSYRKATVLQVPTGSGVPPHTAPPDALRTPDFPKIP